MSRLILFVLADSSCEPPPPPQKKKNKKKQKKKRELQNKKFLPTAGFEPTISRLLDWRSHRMS